MLYRKPGQMVKRKPKIILVSCMHGRHSTVERCIGEMPFIEKYFVYSEPEDSILLDSMDISGKLEFPNLPLSVKWNKAVSMIRDIECDGVVFMGSDDYFDTKFLTFIEANINAYDIIGFKDIYIKAPLDKKFYSGQKIIKVIQKTPSFVTVLTEGNLKFKITKKLYKDYIRDPSSVIRTENTFYWSGYTNYRRGEPVGAGKVYSKKFLDKIEYNLFPGKVDRGLDRVSWDHINKYSPKMLITSLKENELFLCDIKDEDSLTKFERLKNLQQI